MIYAAPPIPQFLARTMALLRFADTRRRESSTSELHNPDPETKNGEEQNHISSLCIYFALGLIKTYFHSHL